MLEMLIITRVARDTWGWRWLDDLACDARYAWLLANAEMRPRPNG
jgi:hypothetical protein